MSFGQAVVRLAQTLMLATVLSSLSCSAFAFDQHHQIFTDELKKYVHAGLVDYASWKKTPEQLNTYLKSLAEISHDDYEAMSTAEKKALWLNGYNAFTIKVVLDHYPIKGSIDYYPVDSLRQIPGVWEDYKFKVAGRDVDLDYVEHCVLRREFHDPRMHFAVVCAARGAAPLADHAFIADEIENILEKSKNDYLSDAKNLKYDAVNKVLQVSRIFNWFLLDFAPASFFKGRTKPPSDAAVICAYLAANGPPELVEELKKQSDCESLTVTFLDYDWALNAYLKN